MITATMETDPPPRRRRGVGLPRSKPPVLLLVVVAHVLFAVGPIPVPASSQPLASAVDVDDGPIATVTRDVDVDVDAGPAAERSVVDSTTLRGRVMAGYQGWFRTPKSGDGREDRWPWRHWMKDDPTHKARPNASNVDVEMWPDMREFHHSELTDTDFVYSDGSNAGLYDARDHRSVRRHVRWMAEYGIDGCFVQRFLSDVLDDRDGRDVVLRHVMKSSEEYGRVFANMYDISGYGRHSSDRSNIVREIREDWIHLVDDLNVTGSTRYLRHRGRPVLAIWGFGLIDREGDASPTEATELIRWLTSDPTTPERYRVTLMGGVDGKFRSQPNFDRWLRVYRSLDVVSPWTVGRYRDANEADSYLDDHMKPDAVWSTRRGIEYMPVVYPGYSFYHRDHDEGKYDEIPRARGSFFWRQVCNAVVGVEGVDMMYVAMFDEVNEGTAIYKVAEDSSVTPTTGRFVTLNDEGGGGGGDGGVRAGGDWGGGVPEKLPSDWYLRLAGEAGRVLKGEVAGEDGTGRNATACRAHVPPQPLLGPPLLPTRRSRRN